MALDIQSLVTWIPLHLTRKWINEEFLNSSTHILGHNSVFLPNKRSRFCFLPGLHDSVIVGSNKNYLTSLSNWLAPLAKSVNSLWKRCWRASVDGWAGSTFHSQCDGKTSYQSSNSKNRCHIEWNIKNGSKRWWKKDINNTAIEKLSYYWSGVQFGFFAIFVLVFVYLLVLI